MPSHTPQDLPEANRLAKRYGMYITYLPTSQGTDYLLYRNGFPCGTLIGKRSSLEDIAYLVGVCTTQQFQPAAQEAGAIPGNLVEINHDRKKHSTDRRHQTGEHSKHIVQNHRHRAASTSAIF